MNSELTSEKLINHKGHDVAIVTYGGENYALECNTCSELLADCDPLGIGV